MNVRTLAWFFAVVFLLIGILGFMPGITTDDNRLLGIFEVDPVHNIIHIQTGAIALFAAVLSALAARIYFKIFGIIYAVVTIAGFIQGDTLLGLMHVNAADNVLHLVIAVVALAAGFGRKGDLPAPAGPTAAPSMPGPR